MSHYSVINGQSVQQVLFYHMLKDHVDYEMRQQLMDAVLLHPKSGFAYMVSGGRVSVCIR